MLKRNAITLHFLISLALVVFSSAGVAQVVPPAREMVDTNGVDLMSGTMTVVYQGPSIGPEGASLGFTRAIRGSTVWDSFIGTIVVDAGGVSVTVDGVTEIFAVSQPAGTWSPQTPNGSTLTDNGSTWTYTTRSGMVATFFERIKGPYPYDNYAYPIEANALLSTVTYASGERKTVEYEDTWTCGAWGDCPTLKPAKRVKSVTSNRGYRMSLGYLADWVGPGSHWTDYGFFYPNQITITNLATGATVGSLSVTYNYDFMELMDPLGRVTKIYPGDVISIIRPGSTASNVTGSHVDGKISSVTRDGITTNYTYSEVFGSPSTRTTTVTNAAGGQRVVVSDITDIMGARVLSDRDELGRTTTYAYDAQGRLSRVTAPEGNFVEYTRDARGNITQTLLRAKPGSGLADIITTAGYDVTCTNPKTCNRPNWTRDAKGNQTDYTYDPAHGGLLTITLPAPTVGAVRPQTRFSYTALEAWYQNSSGALAASGQPLNLLTGVSTCRNSSVCTGSTDESKTVIGYGPTGIGNNLWPVTVTSSDGSGTLVSAVTSAYDLAGNLLTVDGPLAGTADTTRVRYDGLRRIVGMVGPDPDGSGPRTPVATRNSYNAAGHLVTLEKGTVNSQSDADWTSFAPFESVSFEHDATGRRIKSSLSASGTTHAVEQVSYDAVGRPSCVATRMNAAAFGSLPASACTLGAEGGYGPDRITKMNYDAAGQVTTVTTGFGTSNAVAVTSTTYTDNGRVRTVADGASNLTTFEYDGFDRLFKVRYPSPSTPGTSSTTDFEQRAYDANSNVTSVRARNGQTIILTPDNLNRVALKDLPGTEDVYFSYDNQNRLLTAAYDSQTGPGIVHTYDALGRLNTRTAFGRTLDYAYDAAGRRTRVTHPDGFYAEYSYNPAGELTAVTDSTGTTLASYSYDALGRRTGLGRNNGSGTGYGYDAVSRLAALTQDLAGTSYDSTTTFAHTPSAQIASRAQSNDATYTWMPATSSSVGMVPNGLNQLTQVGSTAVGHDQLGNLETGASTFSYGYDLENRLRSAVAGSTTTSLAYDPLGMLSAVTSNGTTTEFLYDGLDLVAEYDSAGAVLRRYVHGAGVDEPLVWYEGSGTTDRRYLHADERGSIVAISSNSGAGIESFKYSPDGESANAANSRFGYTGQVWLAQVGLYYYKSRMYSPKLGRFLQPDAIGYAGGMNLYAYVGGDPINWVDPLGYNPEERDRESFCRQLPTYCTRGDPAADSITERDIADLDRLDEARNARQEPLLYLPVGPYGTINLDHYSAEELVFLGLDIVDFGLARLENNLIEMNILSDPNVLEAGGASRLLRPQVMRDILKFGRRLSGREFPAKPNRGGVFQPYDPKTGRYLPHSANPGLALSPLGRFGSGFASGFAETKGVTGPPPVGRAGAIGYELGRFLGIFN